MYPFVRLAWQMFRHRKDGPLSLTGEHVSHHVCWPWDIDPWMELNNGRTLTLYDLGRLSAGARVGLMPVLKARGWGLTVAGSSVRYRRRVRVFDRIEMRTRSVGWDDRFVYMVQSMWVRGTCCSQALLRTAVTSPGGIVAPARVVEAMGVAGGSPSLPPWVAAWIAADGDRPWPPEPAPPVPRGIG
ncbi:acyl-CoA thioesterase [uncultured Jannaschia sp.]|uniref:acyl-CoA thioesterase n=1 Tax=uncultured Jannaschia sp. TaxID=293347 RepID=UPI00261DD8A0|nr:acyl-CoA thioesterase [uncultured Jannaschia sp.]